MRYVFSVILFVLLAASYSTAQGADFRGVNWGASLEEVIAAEGSEPELKTDGPQVSKAGWEDTVTGVDCVVVYVFLDGQLVKAMYGFIERHSSGYLYLQEYQHVRDALVQKYGEPVKEEDIWNDDLFKDNQDLALVAGHLIRYHDHLDEATTIRHSIHADNYKITHAIEYASTAHADLVKKALQSAADSKL